MGVVDGRWKKLFQLVGKNAVPPSPQLTKSRPRLGIDDHITNTTHHTLRNGVTELMTARFMCFAYPLP